MQKPNRPALRRIERILWIVAAVLVAGAVVLWAVMWWWMRPIASLPPQERARVTERAADYLRAWRAGDVAAVTAMTSPQSIVRPWLERLTRLTDEVKGEVRLTGFVRPATPMARVFAVFWARRNADKYWPRWRRGGVAFVTYRRGGKDYFLMLVRDKGPWMVLNVPACEVPWKHPRKPHPRGTRI
jgi:hypothetical protein